LYFTSPAEREINSKSKCNYIKVKSSGVFKCSLKPNESTLFKMYYDRGDMPVAVSFAGAERKIG